MNTMTYKGYLGFLTFCLILLCGIMTTAQASAEQSYLYGQESMATPDKPTDAQVLGFSKGVKSVEFGFEAGFGYTYHFNREGQLTAVVYTDHGNTGTLLIKDGQVTQCDAVSEGFDEEEPTVPEFFHVTFSYKQLDDETIIYRTNNQETERVGSLYYENGRISRIKSDGKEHTFMYNLEGRAFTQDGTEVYPPLFLFNINYDIF